MAPDYVVLRPLYELFIPESIQKTFDTITKWERLPTGKTFRGTLNYKQINTAQNISRQTSRCVYTSHLLIMVWRCTHFLGKAR